MHNHGIHGIPGKTLKLGSDPTVQTQTADTTVGKNIQSRMCDITNIGKFMNKRVSRVRLQLCIREQLLPLNGVDLVSAPDIDRTALRIISLEVRCVDLDAGYRA